MSISPYVTSPSVVIRQLLTLAHLEAGEVLYDLGAGDGRAIIIAAQEFGAKGVGIELREDLTRQATAKIHKFGLEAQLRMLKKNMLQVDISSANVVYLYLTTIANEKLRPKLESELQEGTRVVSHDYEIRGWRATKVEHFCENPKTGYPMHTLYLYKK